MDRPVEPQVVAVEPCSEHAADKAGGVEKRIGTTGKLPMRVKLSISIGEAVNGMYVTIAGYYLNAFFLETACIDPVYVGMMQALQGVFDAFNDPLIGALSDRTRTRWGRRRPWLLFAAPCLALMYIGMWSALPPSTPHMARFLYSLVMYMGVSVGITSIQVPITALIPELTDDYDERMAISGLRVGIMATMGLAAAVVHNVLVSLYDGSAEGYRVSGFVVAGLMWFAAWFTFAGVRENFAPKQESQERLGFRESIRTLVGNKAYLCVTGAYLCGPMAVVLVQSNLLMFCKYILNDVSVIEKIIPCVQVSGLVCLPLWVALGLYLDKRRVYMIAGTILSTAVGGVFFVTDATGALVSSSLVGVCISVVYMVPFSLLPDVIDEDELRTGKRREGLFCGCFTVCLKASVTGSLTLTNMCLKAMGYVAPVATCGGHDDASAIDEQTTQTEDVLLCVRLLCSLIPAGFVLLAVLLMYKFPITREKQRAVAKLTAQLRVQRVSQSDATRDDAPTECPPSTNCSFKSSETDCATPGAVAKAVPSSGPLACAAPMTTEIRL